MKRVVIRWRFRMCERECGPPTSAVRNSFGERVRAVACELAALTGSEHAPRQPSADESVRRVQGELTYFLFCSSCAVRT